MARRKKKHRAQHRAQREEEQQVTALVADTAARFTCSVEIARDFADQCENPDPHFNLAAGRLAIEFWTGRPEPRAEQILVLLGEFAAANQRYLDFLADLAHRFEAFADDQADQDHEHLEPVEFYQVRVREILFPDPPPTAD